MIRKEAVQLLFMLVLLSREKTFIILERRHFDLKLQGNLDVSRMRSEGVGL